MYYENDYRLRSLRQYTENYLSFLDCLDLLIALYTYTTLFLVYHKAETPKLDGIKDQIKI